MRGLSQPRGAVSGVLRLSFSCLEDNLSDQVRGWEWGPQSVKRSPKAPCSQERGVFIRSLDGVPESFGATFLKVYSVSDSPRAGAPTDSSLPLAPESDFLPSRVSVNIRWTACLFDKGRPGLDG